MKFYIYLFTFLLSVPAQATSQEEEKLQQSNRTIQEVSPEKEESFSPPRRLSVTFFEDTIHKQYEDRDVRRLEFINKLDTTENLLTFDREALSPFRRALLKRKLKEQFKEEFKLKMVARKKEEEIIARIKGDDKIRQESIKPKKEEEIAQYYDEFLLPFIKHLASRNIIEDYYAKSSNWASYVNLKRALKGEWGVDFRDPESILKRYIPAASPHLFSYQIQQAKKEQELSKLLEEEKKKNQKIYHVLSQKIKAYDRLESVLEKKYSAMIQHHLEKERELEKKIQELSPEEQKIEEILSEKPL